MLQRIVIKLHKFLNETTYLFYQLFLGNILEKYNFRLSDSERIDKAIDFIILFI